MGKIILWDEIALRRDEVCQNAAPVFLIRQGAISRSEKISTMTTLEIAPLSALKMRRVSGCLKIGFERFRKIQ